METLFYYVGAAMCGIGGLFWAIILLTAWFNKLCLNATDAYFAIRYRRDRADFKRYMIAIKHKEANQ